MTVVNGTGDTQRSNRRRRLRDEQITLVHGAGGKATRKLVEAVFLDRFDNELLAPLGDSALLEVGGVTLALTTDSHVVQPLIFPGGDIGELAVNGTVNDLAVAGARPIALTAGYVLEEGLAVETLDLIAQSMARAAAAAGVVIAAGDTKVVEAGRGDGLTVTTSGLGIVDPRAQLGAQHVKQGDKIIVSGTIADHGMAVMIARGELALEVEIESDTASIYPLAERLFALDADLRWLRDPTRGGLATTLNELAAATDRSLSLIEEAIPLRGDVAAACEILGIDPLYVANEGKLVAVVAPERADEAVTLLREHPLGRAATIIGEVTDEDDRLVLLETPFGGARIVDEMVGDPLPRIC